GLGHPYGTPGLGRRKCTGKTFDAMGGCQVVARLPSQPEALRKRRTRASGIALSQRVLGQEIERPDESPTDAQLASELQTLLQPLAGGGVVAARRRDSPKHAERQDRPPSLGRRLAERWSSRRSPAHATHQGSPTADH